ncbi:MAG: hypothetical protein Q9218_007172 [Villophora microphyllina]
MAVELRPALEGLFILPAAMKIKAKSPFQERSFLSFVEHVALKPTKLFVRLVPEADIPASSHAFADRGLANVLPRESRCFDLDNRRIVANHLEAYGGNLSTTASASPSLVTAPASDAACCFVVQDTIDIRHWGPSTWYGQRNITTVVTSITEYADTTITNLHRTTRLVNTTSVTYPTAQIHSYNGASGRQTSRMVTLNGSAVVTAGMTIQSPQAFYLYSSAKIIRVPPVTDRNGNLACTTASSGPSECTSNGISCPDRNSAATGTSQWQLWRASCVTTSVSTQFFSTKVFGGINTYAEDYFESHAFPDSYGSQAATALASLPPSVFNYSVISFSTPFAFQPTHGANEGMDPEETMRLSNNVNDRTKRKRALVPAATVSLPNSGANEDYGYVPRALIDWIAQNPNYAAQYPGIGSCLPGGPVIMPLDPCAPRPPTPMPVVLDPAQDLTMYSTVTVQGEGCFNPVGCPVSQPTSNPMGGIQALPAAIPNPAQPSPTGPTTTSNPASIAQLPDVLAPKSTGESQAGRIDQPNLVLPPVVGQKTPAVIPQPQSPPQTVIIGSNTITADSNSQFVIGFQTLAPGSSAIQVGGSTLSIPATPTALIINGSPSPLPLPVPPLGSQDPNAESPSGNGNAADSPQDIASLIMSGFRPEDASPEASPAPIVVPIGTRPDSGGAGVSPGASEGTDANSLILIAGTTLTPGAPLVTIQGTTYSLPSAGDSSANPTAIYITGSPSPLSPSTFQSSANAQVVIAGTTLIAGASPIVVSGVTYSLPSASNPDSKPTAVFVNGSPSPLPPTANTQSTKVDWQPNLMIGSQTLIPGSAMTIDGQIVSLPAATGAGEIDNVVVGGTTETLVVPSSGTGAAVGFTIGSAIVTAAEGTSTPSASGASSKNGTGVSGASGSGAGGNATAYTGPGFANGASSSLFPETERWMGSWYSFISIFLVGVCWA